MQNSLAAFYAVARGIVLGLAFVALAQLAQAQGWPAGAKTYRFANADYGDQASACAALMAADPGVTVACQPYYATTTECATPPAGTGWQQFGIVQGQANSGGTLVNSTYCASIYVQCPSGSVPNYESDPANPTCQNSVCVTNINKVFEYEFAVAGAVDYGPGRTTCQEGCEASTIQGDKYTIELNGGAGPSRTYFSGTARITGNACPSAAPTSTRTTAFRTNEGAPTTQGSPGTGVMGGPGQNDSSVANMARIATNTDKIAKLLGAGVPGGGGGGTVSAPGVESAVNAQKAAITAKLDEVVASTDGQAALDVSSEAATAISAKRAELEAALDATKNSLELKSLPDFGGQASRWTWALDPFVGASSECSHTWAFNVASLPTVSGFTLNICQWAPYFRGFMFWALGLYTAFALWELIYAAGRRQASNGS